MIRAFEPGDLEPLRALFREYALGVGDEICFTQFARELAELPGSYAPLLLSIESGGLAGCVALRPLAPTIAEIKRLYVRPDHRGRGIARALIDALLSEAASEGYRLVRLDTLPRMTAAIALYKALGFREIPPYANNPASAICFELALPDNEGPRAGFTAPCPPPHGAVCDS